MKGKLKILLFTAIAGIVLLGSAFDRSTSPSTFDIDTTRSPIPGFEKTDIATQKKHSDTVSAIKTSRPSGPWKGSDEDKLIIPAGGEE